MISYPYIKVSPNPHQRNFAVDDDQHREPQLAKVQIIRDYRILRHNGSIYPASPPPKAQGSLQKRVWNKGKRQRW